MEKLTLEALRTKAEVPKVKKLDTDTVDLAHQALSVLGYKVLRNHVEDKPLASALERLEIEVIPWTDVKEYQAQVIQELTGIRPSSVDFDDDEDEDEEDEEPSRSRKMKSANDIGARPPYAGRHLFWGRQKIQSCQEEIPKFVLRKAIQVKMEVPQAEFYVESLREFLDPFLLVTLGDKEKYYMEVWEEPKFEGRRTTAKKQSKKVFEEEDE